MIAIPEKLENFGDKCVYSPLDVTAECMPKCRGGEGVDGYCSHTARLNPLAEIA